MIIDVILKLIQDMLLYVIGLMPAMPVYEPDKTGFISLVNHVSFFLPISTIVGCISAIVSVHVVMNSIWILNWVVKRIRGG